MPPRTMPAIICHAPEDYRLEEHLSPLKIEDSDIEHMCTDIAKPSPTSSMFYLPS